MSFDESNVRRDTAGKFDEKGHSAPEIALPQAVQAHESNAAAEIALLATVEPRPEDVLNAEFTVTSLTEHFGAEPTLDADEDGNTVADFWRDSYSSRFGTRVVIDDGGEIIRVDNAWNSDISDGEWAHHDHLQFDRERHTLRGVVNRDRLAFAGILTENEGAGTGVYGYRYLGGRAKEGEYDAAVIATNIRRDIARAREFGAIPDNLEYNVRTSKYSGGQSIGLSVTGVPDSQQYAELEEGFPHGRSPWASELHDTLDLIGSQWQDDQTDSQQDYFHVRYYLSVYIHDEQSVAFQAKEKAKAAARRAELRAQKMAAPRT